MISANPEVISSILSKSCFPECSSVGDTRGRDRVGGLDIPVTVVDAYNQEVVIVFQYLYLRNIFIQLSG